MSIVVVGVNHRSAPLDLLERFSLAPDEWAKAVTTLVQRDTLREAAVLATCNRFEVYAVAEKFHPGYADLRDFLCEVADVDADSLAHHLFSQHDTAAVSHLFEVAAGLDSMVIGESEILGQVRAAGNVARASGGLRATLDLLFRRALTTGKRARTETGISRGTASVSHAAVEMAVDRLGGLTDARAAVVGAGDMGSGVAVALRKSGAADIVVVNRTADRGHGLATKVDGSAVGFDRLDAILADRDLVVTCVGSGAPVLTAAQLRRARPRGAPLLVVDIAMPRDTESGLGDLSGVTVLDLDDVRRWAERGVAARAAEAARVRAIVAEEVEQFTLELSARQAAPLVAQLHERAEAIRQAELAKLTVDDPEQRAVVETVTRAILAKLLHEPSVRLRTDAGTPRGERNAAAVSDLFDLS